MTSKKHIEIKLDFLYCEREKIESTGTRIDPDLRKIHKFIGKEIQDLRMCLFKYEYQQFSDRFIECGNSDSGCLSRENGHDIS